jgi:hypothetical protein
MKIAILDHENARTIIANVPAYLSDVNRSSDDIAEAIITALGLSSDSCEWIIGEFEARIDFSVYNEPNTGIRELDELTGDFKADALEALADTEE